jgi:hypothetical protein
VFRHFGWDVEEARQQVLEGFVMSTFRNLLFQRVIPNLKRIGLLTDTIRPKFEELGILEFENLATDGDIDWSALERPLDTDEAQSTSRACWRSSRRITPTRATCHGRRWRKPVPRRRPGDAAEQRHRGAAAGKTTAQKKRPLV